MHFESHVLISFSPNVLEAILPSVQCPAIVYKVLDGVVGYEEKVLYPVKLFNLHQMVLCVHSTNQIVTYAASGFGVQSSSSKDNFPPKLKEHRT